MSVDLVQRLAVDARTAPVLRLLGDPVVTVGDQRVEIPDGCRRLVAFVALHPRPVDRRQISAVLWPDCCDARAAGNLRTALWRLHALGVPLVAAGRFTLAVRHDVAVDVHLIGSWATRLITGRPLPDDLTVPPPGLGGYELLPGWGEEWILVERERLRQRVLHALEALSRFLVAAGRYAEAVETAIVAVGADPLRESAQTVLIESHLAEGNQVEAARALASYRRLLRRELGVEPGAALIRLAAARTARTAGPAFCVSD